MRSLRMMMEPLRNCLLRGSQQDVRWGPTRLTASDNAPLTMTLTTRISLESTLKMQFFCGLVILLTAELAEPVAHCRTRVSEVKTSSHNPLAKQIQLRSQPRQCL